MIMSDSILTKIMQSGQGVKRRVKELLKDPEYVANQTIDELASQFYEDPLSMVGPHVHGAAGILRRYGVPGLNSWVEIPEDNLYKLLHGKGELTSPSMYVAKGGPRYKFGDYALVGRPDKLDPINRPGKLYNRDSWTPVKQEFPANDTVENRLKNKFAHGGFDDYRRGSALGDIGHRLMIEQSPVFRSFKEFEDSPYGAKVLTGSTSHSGLPKHIARELNREMAKESILHNARRLHLDIPGDESLKRFMSDSEGVEDRVNFPGFSSLVDDWRSLRNPSKYHQFRKTVTENNPYSQRLTTWARSAPSNYAELKVSGPLALTSENFVGAIPRVPDMSDPIVNELLRKRGIPVLDRSVTGTSEKDMINLMNTLTEESAYPLEHLMVKPDYEELRRLTDVNDWLQGKHGFSPD